MKKLFNHLLKNHNDKYSRKSFIILVTFFFVLFLGGYLTCVHKPNPEGKGVFDSLLFFLGTMVFGSIADKKIESKDKNE